MNDFVRKLTEKISKFPKFEKDYDDDNMQPYFDAYNMLIDIILAEIERVGLDKIEIVKTQTKDVFTQMGEKEVGDFESFWIDGIMPAFDKPVNGKDVGWFTYPNPGFILKDFALVLLGIAIFFGLIFVGTRLLG